MTDTQFYMVHVAASPSCLIFKVKIIFFDGQTLVTSLVYIFYKYSWTSMAQTPSEPLKYVPASKG